MYTTQRNAHSPPGAQLNTYTAHERDIVALEISYTVHSTYVYNMYTQNIVYT